VSPTEKYFQQTDTVQRQQRTGLSEIVQTAPTRMHLSQDVLFIIVKEKICSDTLSEQERQVLGRQRCAFI
jgi:hypothetical protein